MRNVERFDLMPLVEVHNREELELALEYDSEIIGINNRNLKTFNTTLETTEKLIKYIPKGKIIVSESGIMSIEDLKRVKRIWCKWGFSWRNVYEKY